MGAIHTGLPWWGGGHYDIGDEPSSYVAGAGIDFLRQHYSGGPVADMGCWTGRHFEVLASLGGQIEGIDRLVALDMVRQAALRYPEVRFREYHLQDMRALENGHYGAALIWRVLHNMRIPVLTSAVSEIARVLRPRAPVVLAVRAELELEDSTCPVSRITGKSGEEREDLYFTRSALDKIFAGHFHITHAKIHCEGEWIGAEYSTNKYWTAHLIRR